MKSINKILKEIDETVKIMEPRSKQLNPEKWHPTYHYAYNPKDKKPIESPANKHLWETTVLDHNNSYIVFMFKTTDVYGMFRGNGSGNVTERKRILNTSETRKPFYKNNGVEVGLTIEHTLKNPTENCWGYSWGKSDYYIIKDDELTITERRSVIRKIYNGKNVKDNRHLIKFDWPYLKTLTGELEEINELFKNVWLVTVEGKDYILSTEYDLWEWIYDTFEQEDYFGWWEKELGGKDAIIERLLSGVSFNIKTYLHMNFNLNDLLPYSITDEPQRAEVLHSNWDFDNEVSLKGLTVYEIID